MCTAELKSEYMHSQGQLTSNADRPQGRPANRSSEVKPLRFGRCRRRGWSFGLEHVLSVLSCALQ